MDCLISIIVQELQIIGSKCIHLYSNYGAKLDISVCTEHWFMVPYFGLDLNIRQTVEKTYIYVHTQ